MQDNSEVEELDSLVYMQLYKHDTQYNDSGLLL